MSAYVRQSAKLKCSMGSAQSALQVSHPANPVLLCGSPMAAMADSKPMANIAPFGLCKSLANPTVAAATAAAGGKLQKMPCIPCVTMPWAVAKTDVLVKGLPALTNESRCVCMWLGMIKIKNPGQKYVSDTAPPPFIPEDSALQAAASQAKEGGPKAAGTPTPQGGAPQTPKKGLLTSVTDYVKALIKNTVNTVKNRVAAVAAAIATAVQGYVAAILATAGAAATAVVGGIFGIRGKGDGAVTDENAAEKEENAATSESCFCNRDIEVDEFEEIVRCLRKADGRKDISLFTSGNCNIPREDKTIQRLAEEFNTACEIYGINHCIQKIHFLSQIYCESAHFDTTLEYKDGTNYNPGCHDNAKRMGHTENGDGPRYKGRGLMQITWRKTQLCYLKYARDNIEILKGRTDADIEDRNNDFQKIISDTLAGCVDSAGWYWCVYKQAFYPTKYQERFKEIKGMLLNKVALYGDKYQEGISIAINGGENALLLRRKYYDNLKIIMKADQCPNLAKTDIGQAPQITVEADKAKPNIGGTDKAKQNTAPKAKTAIVARLTRNHFGSRRTFGAFEVFHNGELIFTCDSCEDVVRGKGYGPDADTVKKWKIVAESAIPYGTYICIRAENSTSRHAKRWYVDGVPGYSGIRIHDGNNETWTEGCLLLGVRDSKYTKLDKSVETIAEFEKHIKEHGNEKFVLEISAPPQPAKAEIAAKQKAFNQELINAAKANATNSGTCFCNRDFKLDELRRIIYGLREVEKNVTDCLFSSDNCCIPEEEKTIDRLMQEINKTCRTYKINTCIQKIHFLSQIYCESDRFRTTLEYKSGDDYELGRHDEAKNHDHTVTGDGPKYKGKGLIRLTWRDAQIAYLKSVKDKNEVLIGIRNVIIKEKTTASAWGANKEIVDKNPKDHSDATVNAKIDAIIDKRCNNYEQLISDCLSASVDSAGWYWNSFKTIPFKIDGIHGKTLNSAALFADKYQEIISKTINDDDKTVREKKMYYNKLKEIMNVKQCTNKSIYQGDLS